MVSQASAGSTSTAFSPFAAAYARAAAWRRSYSSASSSIVCGRKNEGRCAYRHGSPPNDSSGSTGVIRPGATSAEPNPSATDVTIFSPVQQPVVAGQLVGVPAQVEHFLGGAGHQDRHSRVVQRDLARAGQRGRLGLRVVADRADHAAVRADTVQVGVPEHVAAAVHPRRLAVPHADDPVAVLQRRQVVLLAAPHRGGRQVLVHSRDPAHVMLGQQRRRCVARVWSKPPSGEPG